MRSIFVQCKETPNEDCMMFFAAKYSFLTNPDGSRDVQPMTVAVPRDNKHISPLAKRLFAIDGVDEVTVGHNFVTVTRQTLPPAETLEEAGSGDGGGVEQEESEASIRQRIAVTNTEDVKIGKGFVPPASDKKQHPLSPQVKTHRIENAMEWQPPVWFDLQLPICAALADHAHSGEPALEADAPHPHRDTLPDPSDSEVVASIKEVIATLIRPQVQMDGGDIRFLAFDDSTGEMKVELLGACKTCKSSRTTLQDLIERSVRHWIPEVTSVVEVIAKRAVVGHPQNSAA